MDDRGGGSFVAVRRISQGLDRGNPCHSASGIIFSLSGYAYIYRDMTIRVYLGSNFISFGSIDKN